MMGFEINTLSTAVLAGVVVALKYFGSPARVCRRSSDQGIRFALAAFPVTRLRAASSLHIARKTPTRTKFTLLSPQLILICHKLFVAFSAAHWYWPRRSALFVVAGERTVMALPFVNLVLRDAENRATDRASAAGLVPRQRGAYRVNGTLQAGNTRLGFGVVGRAGALNIFGRSVTMDDFMKRCRIAALPISNLTKGALTGQVLVDQFGLALFGKYSFHTPYYTTTALGYN